MHRCRIASSSHILFTSVMTVGMEHPGNRKGRRVMTRDNLQFFAVGVSIMALAWSITSFAFSRRRRLRVCKVQSFFSRNAAGAHRILEVDLLSYGTAIFDIAVEVFIFVAPSKQTIKDGTAGEFTLMLSPEGELPNPLSAGKGVRFSLNRSDPMEERDENCYRPVINAFKIAKSRNIYIRVTCSEGRKTLKRIRGRRIMRHIDQYLGDPRNVGWRWWENILSTLHHRKILRESKKYGGAVPSMNKRSISDPGRT